MKKYYKLYMEYEDGRKFVYKSDNLKDVVRKFDFNQMATNLLLDVKITEVSEDNFESSILNSINSFWV